MKRALRTTEQAPQPSNDNAQPSHDNARPAFFTVDAVAAILDVDRKTIYAAIASGELKALRLGRVIRIPARVIDELAEGRIASSGSPRSR